MKLDNRIWYVVTALVCVALVAGGVLLGIQPQLTAMATAAADKASVDSQISGLRTQISDLTAAKAKSSELEKEAAELRKKLPAGVDGSSFIAELTSIAASTGIDLKSLQLETPAAYAPPAAPAPAVDPSASGASASATPSESASPTPAATAPAATTGATPYTDPAVTAANFVVIPVTVTASGTRDQLLAMVSQLQRGDRLVLVTGITLTEEDTGSNTISIKGNVYALANITAPPAATNG